MSYRYGYTTILTIGRNDRDVAVSYTVTPGAPERGPTYDCGGEPAEPAEVVIRGVEICVETPQPYGRPTIKTWVPAPDWLVAIIENDEDMISDMLSEAGEDDACAANAADALRDERRSMGAW